MMKRASSAAHTRLGIWLPLTLLIVLVGVASSVLFAQALANSEAQNARNSFRFASEEIGSSLKLSISREEDLIVSTRAHLVGYSAARTPTDFDRWVESIEAMQRYPELQAIGFDVLVPASRLAAFKAYQSRNPIRPFGARGPGAWEAGVLPSEGQRFYCLAIAGMTRDPESFVPVATNYCALAPTMMYDREAGAPNYAPVTLAGKTTLGIATPVYSTGAAPRTVAARRRTFLGWVGELLAPDLVISQALEGHPKVAVKFAFSSPIAHVVFAKGKIPKGAMTDTVVVHDVPAAHARWVLRTFTTGVSTLLFDRPNALFRLLAGLVLTLLASSFILTLATGRRRALALVHEKTRELSHQALHDTLTGLPNRALVLDRARQLLARSARQPGAFAGAMFIDVDGFKHVNDNLGHAAGDQLLKVVAERLRATVRDSDTVGRLGGDEFVVLVESASVESLNLLADRLTEVLREPVELSDGRKLFSLSASVGVALGSYQTPDALLRDADLALYAAKAAGKDRYALFDASMHQGAADRLALEADLATAVEAEQFVLVYQPVFALATQELVAVEALVRWNHPTRGLLMPDSFISLAEDNGMIVPIGRWVLGQACAQAALWKACGIELGVAVNVSAVQLGRKGLVEDVRAALRESGIEPRQLTLELTETTLTREVAAAAEHLEAIKSLGVHVAIDDFGTGYASLSQLQRIPVDSLKIDRSFVAALTSEGEGRTLLEAVIGVGRALALTVVAEGIETPDQLAALREMGCEMAQGFYLARPMSAQAVEQLLRPVALPSTASGAPGSSV